MYDVNGPMDPERTEALLRALDRCQCGDAKIVAVTETHAMLVLRITTEQGMPVTLMCGECKRLETHIRWRVGQLQYEVASTQPYRYRLFDASAGFSVECGVVLVAQHADEWKAVDSPA